MKSLNSWPVKVACVGALVLVLLVWCPDSWNSQADAKSKSGREALASSYFRLDVDGKPLGMFKSCVGIGSAHETTEQKVADKQGGGVVQKVPGQLRWHDITLTRGLTTDTAVWAWRQQVVDGRIGEARKNCVITLMDYTGQPAAAWDLMNVWPSNLTVNAEGAGDSAVEVVVITPERVVRKQ